jgi:GNAT superfamily N-acetyltransferase
MRIVPFAPAHLPAAGALLALRHRAQRAAQPVLPVEQCPPADTADRWAGGLGALICERACLRGSIVASLKGGTRTVISYRTSIEGLRPDQLQGFFVGWPNPPKPETHLRLLAGSSHVVLALDDESGQVVGFITAVSDGVLSAYIPLLEVLPAYQRRGIGQELTRRMLEQLRGLYMVDLLCDPELQPFYERVGMRPATGMLLRSYDRQAGE